MGITPHTLENILALFSSILIFLGAQQYLVEYGILPKYKLFVLSFALLLFVFRKKISEKLGITV